MNIDNMAQELIFRFNQNLPPNTRKIEIGFLEDNLLIGQPLSLEKYLEISNNIKIEIRETGANPLYKATIYYNQIIGISQPIGPLIFIGDLIYTSTDEKRLYPITKDLEIIPPIERLLWESNYLPHTFQKSR